MCPGDDASGKSHAIDVVLHEYDSLRAEMQDRMTARFQLIGFCRTGLAGRNVKVESAA